MTMQQKSVLLEQRMGNKRPFVSSTVFNHVDHKRIIIINL